MGLVGKANGSRSENEIQNPKAFVFVALNALIVSKYGDAVGKRVPINVNETGAKEGDCGFNGIDGDGDIDGESGCG